MKQLTDERMQLDALVCMYLKEYIRITMADVLFVLSSCSGTSCRLSARHRLRTSTRSVAKCPLTAHSFVSSSENSSCGAVSKPNM